MESLTAVGGFGNGQVIMVTSQREVGRVVEDWEFDKWHNVLLRVSGIISSNGHQRNSRSYQHFTIQVKNRLN